MVCKEDVVTFFQRLNAHKRIDIMCSLIEMCLPLEVRFFGTCLEDIGKRDFHDLRDAENKANDSSGHSEMQCLREKRTQRLLVVIVSLLRSCNHKCSNSLYRILEKLDFSEIITIINNTPAEENPLDELLLLYTIALNHPAFTFEQKSVFGDILVMLQEEDIKMQSTKTMSMGLVYHNSPLQPCNPCSVLPEDRTQLDTSTLSHCVATSTAQPVQDLSSSRSSGSFPPGLNMPPGLSLPPEQQLTPTNYVHVAYTSPSHQPVSSLPWQSAIAPVIISSLCQEPQGVDPLPSRPSSPCVSRSGSPQPGSEPVVLAYPKTVRRVGSRHNSIDTTVPPPPVAPVSSHNKTCGDVLDPLQETIEKEMPNYLSNLQNYSIEEVKRMSDDELNGLGLPKGAISQLRSIVTKLQNTNGMCSLDKNDPNNAGARRKQDNPTPVTEAWSRRSPASSIPASGPYVRAYPPAEKIMYPSVPGLMAAPPGGPCFTCIALPSPSRFQPQQFYCVNHNLRNLRLDSSPAEPAPVVLNHSHSSSASNSSSASHSPPETPPSFANQQLHWDKGFSMKEGVGGGRDHSSPGCDDRGSDKKLPEAGDIESPNLSHPPIVQTGGPPNNNNNNRPRLPGGLGRARANPPGMQTVPVSRGRGLKPVTVILEGNQKVLPSCRRDGPMMNGMPRTSHPPPPLLSQYTATSQPPPPHYATASRSGGAAAGGTDNVPYTTAFLPQTHFHPLRTTGSIFHSFPPGSYIRPTFQFPPNGELVYQPYHQTPPPPPSPYMQPVQAYSTGFPPPKVSCYNCGQGHHATDCKETTIEEATNPVQYHLDYTPYQKPGAECLTEK